MANPYTLTYKIGKLVDVGELTAGGHAIKMSIAFTVNADGTDTVRLAKDYGIFIASWGELVWERDITNNYIVPGRYQFKLFDKDDELKSLFFEGALAPYVNKDAKITLEIKYYGDASYTEEYVGYIDNTSIEWKDKGVSIIAFPRIDQIKSIYLYDRNENGSLSYRNPLDLSFSITNSNVSANPLNPKTLIHSIYQKIEKYCTLSWQHNWEFKLNVGGAPTYKLENTEFTGNYLSAIFFSADNRRQIENLYDLITRLSFTFGFITGMLTANKAFVKDLFYYDPNNTQPVGGLISHTIMNKYGDIDAARITGRYFDLNTTTGTKNAYGQTRARTITVPSVNHMRGENIIDDELVCYIDNDVNFDRSDLRRYYLTQNYPVKGVDLPSVAGIGGGYSLYEAVAIFYYNIRNRQQIGEAAGATSSIGRVDKYQFTGLKYDYMKDFSYGGNGYQILSLKKVLDENYAEIESLYVADVMKDYTGADTPTDPQPLVNVLPGGYLRDYSYNAEIEPDDVNTGTYDLFEIPEGFELKKIIVKINTAFNNITSFKIIDDDGDLIPESRISNEDDEVIESYQYKNYSAAKTISAVFTISASCTVGDADIILELRTRL